MIKLHEYANIGTHWIDIFFNNNDEVIYFDSFGVKNIQKEIKNVVGDKDIKANIYRIQGCDSITCGYFCVWFIDFVLNYESLLDRKNFFSSKNSLEKWWY